MACQMPRRASRAHQDRPAPPPTRTGPPRREVHRPIRIGVPPNLRRGVSRCPAQSRGPGPLSEAQMSTCPDGCGPHAVPVGERLPVATLINCSGPPRAPAPAGTRQNCSSNAILRACSDLWQVDSPASQAESLSSQPSSLGAVAHRLGQTSAQIGRRGDYTADHRLAIRNAPKAAHRLPNHAQVLVLLSPNGCAFPIRRERLPHQLVVGVRAINFGCVEECHPSINSWVIDRTYRSSPSRTTHIVTGSRMLPLRRSEQAPARRSARCGRVRQESRQASESSFGGTHPSHAH